MARGETTQTKVHYKGSDDFVIFIDDVETYQKWKTDKSIPLAHFISSFKIFLTHGQGVQGTLDAASKAALENEFGTSVDDDVIKQILEKGETQNTEFPERQGNKNDNKGPLIAH
ncbi:shwachman-bodian-diamond syndrome [Fusarium longipes]|uniref:Shwachman-bodian-diamond syndrome n=1 Tax=Fusarium longipes TaxID=694270 RepID=A0A395SRC5_9HYPO|nr:shwachman-bodian-diamond syndrome [Fusarium longipes]